MKRTILIATSILALIGTAGANTYFADANAGSDAAAGTIDQPFQTLSRCLSAIQVAGDVCELRAGTYSAVTTEPVSMPSGTVGNPIIVQGFGNERVVIRQGSTLPWTQVSGNLWRAPFDYNLVVKRQILQSAASSDSYFERGIRLWNDSVPLPEACFPNLTGGANSFHTVLVAEGGSGTNQVRSSQIQGKWNLKDARVVVSARQHLGTHAIGITGSSAGQVSFVGDSPWAVAPGAWFYLEGGKDLIDSPWEWAADSVNKFIYLQTDGSDPNQLPIRVQTSSTAFFLKNASLWTIHDLQFQGVVPVSKGSVTRILFHHLRFTEAGLLRFNDNLWDYTQKAGLLLGDDSRIHHSTFEGCDGRCVDMNGMRDTVDNNSFHNGGRLGQFEGTVSITRANGVIARNDIFGSGFDGITTVTTSADNLLVRRNWITGAGMFGSDASGVRVSSHGGVDLIDSNLVSGTRQGAGPATNGSIGGAGVFLDDASQLNDVLFNVFTDMGTGVVLNCDASYGTYTSLYNRAGNNTGINLGSFANFRQLSGLIGTKFADNILSGPLTTSGSNIMFPVTGSPADVSALGRMGMEYYTELNVGVNPLLTDPPHLDFRPQPGSPAIDAGIVYLHDQVFLGSAPDDGAVESGGRQWVYGVYDDPPKWVCSPVLCFEDATLWTPVWGTSTTLSNTKDRIEGVEALSVVPNDFVWLESAYMDQSVAKGFNSIMVSFKLSTMVNPYYYGSVMFFLDAPSQNVNNQYVGQVVLTGYPLNAWSAVVLTIPADVAAQLAGKTFNDFRMRMAVNIPVGSGPIIFDYLRLLP